MGWSCTAVADETLRMIEEKVMGCGVLMFGYVNYPYLKR